MNACLKRAMTYNADPSYKAWIKTTHPEELTSAHSSETTSSAPGTQFQKISLSRQGAVASSQFVTISTSSSDGTSKSVTSSIQSCSSKVLSELVVLLEVSNVENKMYKKTST